MSSYKLDNNVVGLHNNNYVYYWNFIIKKSLRTFKLKQSFLMIFL
jgi:hypothetical protein